MSDPGRLLASGRAADVFDLGDGTVLRRYRTDRHCELEGRVMTWLAEQGVPVPAVHRAERTDIIMELVAGPTMMEDLEVRPWRLVRYARLLARLQRSVNVLRAPSWFPRSSSVPDRGQVTHLDLHPMNVILSDRGPVIIDWTNAASGDGAFDAATSYVLMSTFEAVGARDRIGQKVLVEVFRQTRGRSEIRGALSAAAAHRLADRNTTLGERDALRRLI